MGFGREKASLQHRGGGKDLISSNNQTGEWGAGSAWGAGCVIVIGRKSLKGGHGGNEE